MGKFILLVMLTGVISFTACDSDDVGDNLYTFTDQMMGQYLADDLNDSVYSEFARLLDTTKVMGLLNAYGQYTCFAPTNQAMKAYYQAKGKNSLKDFTLDSLKTIAYDHIINGSVIMYVSFAEGRLSDLSMSDRYLSINFESTNAFVNKSSKILLKDILVHNGVVHRINKVLDPTREGVVDVIAKDSTFGLFYDALVLTGMADSLLKDRDETYNAALYKSLVTVPKESNQWFYQEVPAFRKYGYTVLMESDATYAANNIHNLADLKAYAASVYDAVYPADAGVSDVTDRRNSLNRFISYHLINKQLSSSKFINDYDTDHMIKTQNMYEYVETMCPNTLMEVAKTRVPSRTNLFNYISEDKVVQLTSNYDNDASNGVYHEIDRILEYNKDVDAYLSSKRLRFDAASFFPELTNNNMRGSQYKANSSGAVVAASLHYQVPRNYIDRIKASEQTVVGYLAGYPKFQDYMADEIFLSASAGKLYDFTITTPAIPAGTYEIRFGYQTNGKRGVAQLYVDNVPAGVPLNLNNYANNVAIGYETPTSTNLEDPFGFENDKMMRNRGYMKAPACFKVPVTGWSGGENARYSTANLRKILGTYTFETASTHELTVKGLSGGEFMFDYLEFVPTSVIENEDIY